MSPGSQPTEPLPKRQTPALPPSGLAPAWGQQFLFEFKAEAGFLLARQAPAYPPSRGMGLGQRLRAGLLAGVGATL